MKDRLTLDDLAREIAESEDISITTVKKVLASLVRLVKKHMLNGESVLIWSLGSFRTYERSPRKSHDVSTGEVIELPGGTHPKFEFSRRFIKEFK